MYERYIKRALDIAISLVSLIILSPLFLLIAIAIKLGSPGPVIFRQKRFGKDRGFFETCKWRLEDPPSVEKKAIEAGT